MTTITVYSRRFCGYCGAAKQLLASHDYAFEEVNLDEDLQLLSEIMKKSGQRTVPQIFVNDTPVGGFRDLYSKLQSGEFAELVEG